MAKKNGSGVSLNMVAFYTLLAIAVLYLVAIILSAVGGYLRIVGIMQSIAAAVALIIVAIVGWKYVASKQTVWKVLYFVVLLVIIAGIIVPLVI